MRKGERGAFRSLMVALALLSLAPTPSYAAEGAVSGTIVNGTRGGPAPSGLDVTVVQIDKTQKELARRSARSDSEGRFSLEGFEEVAGSRYLALTSYHGVAYSKIATAEASSDVRLEVFETTTDEAVIQIQSETLTVVQGVEDQMEVLQVVRIANKSDRTFVGRSGPSGEEKPITIRLPLPEGAFDVSLSDTLSEGGVEAIPEGLSTAKPVMPGESSFSFAYKVRVPRSGWQLRRAVLYPTMRIDLLIDDALSTTAPRFDLQERPELGGKRYRRYRHGPLQPGDILGADIGYPQTRPGSALFAAVGGGLVFLLLIAGIARATRRRPKTSQAPNRQDLIHRIAELDEAFAQGRIDEESYNSSRQRMKRELMDAAEAASSGSR